jgi:hypothetical protein
MQRKFSEICHDQEIRNNYLIDTVTSIVERAILSGIRKNKERNIGDYVTVYSAFCVEEYFAHYSQRHRNVREIKMYLPVEKSLNNN